ncbi:MAG: amino acid adenylation domain-containing protein [Chloroflexota bacterium]
MDTTLDLLLDLKQKNIHLWVDDDRLRYDAPKGALTPELGALLRQHKADLMDFLRTTAPMPSTAIQPVDRTAPLPLSFAQERLWFLDQLEGSSAVYNLPEAWRLEGPLNVDALEQSLQALVARHESLRTTFAAEDGVPYQLIHTELPIELPLTDLRGFEPEMQEAEVERLTIAEATHPFDLSRDSMMRATLLRVSPQNGTMDAAHILLLTFHHIAIDGWSMGILLRELAGLYEAFSQGQSSPFTELVLQYADFAVWQRDYLQGEVLDQQLGYWQRTLAGAPELLQLPTDRPRPAQQSFRGDVMPLTLDDELTQQLKALSQQQGATLFMTLLAAFQVLLSRYSGQTDIVVGSPIANRNRQEVEPMVGFFVNTLALRADLSSEPTFVELLAQVQKTTQAAYANQDIPFEQVVQELQISRSLNHSPLFQVMFALQNAPMEAFALRDLSVSLSDIDIKVTRFDIEMHFWEVDCYLQGYCIFNSDLFDKATIERLMGHFQTLLNSIVKQPLASIAELPLLTEQERRQLLSLGRGTAMDYPKAKGIHHLFEEQVSRTPDAVALCYGQEQLTYRELNKQANQLAHHLITQGVQPNSLVGVSVERSIGMVVALLATLKAGGVYLPLDPTYPAERLRFMLDDAKINMLVVGQGTLALLPTTAAIIVDPAIATGSITNPAVDCELTNLAYVLYTSGSTGQPKGVAVPHRTLCNLITWQAHESYAPERTLQFAPMNFDVSLQELFATLCVGGTLVLVDEETRRDPYALLVYLRAERITRLFLPFIALQQLAEVAEGEMPPTLREVMTAGEQLQITAAIRTWFRVSRCILVNQYGPTESHVVTAHKLADDVMTWSTLPPIGHPIANTELYILDSHGEPVPIGINGELHIGGDVVAQGYLHRDELTQAKFVGNPFGEGQLYKSGDLCRWLPDGNIEFLGRIDTQVKIRGFRVELGEIEAQLSQYPAVREAAVVVHEASGGNKELVGYIVGNNKVDISGLRDALSQQLPDYMVPAYFVQLETMPLTPSGKVDRRTLPAPDTGTLSAETEYIPPTTPTEMILAGMWCALLGLNKVGVEHNFFALGGHSLLATQVVSRIRQRFAIDLLVRTLFENATISALANAIDLALNIDKSTAQPTESPTILPTDHTTSLPLSYAQERLWFFEQLVDVESVYNMPIALRLQGSLDIGALERTLYEIVARHENLRTTFVPNTDSATVEQMVSGDIALGQPAQVVQPASFTLPILEVSAVNPLEAKTEIYRLANEEARTPFAFALEPSFRAKLLRLSSGDHVLLLTLHHIVFDGWSTGILFHELSELYRAYSSGESSPLPELPIQYADFAVWQRQWLGDQEMETQIAYWQKQLSGLQAFLPLPTDYPRPAVQSYQGDVYESHLPADLMARITQLSVATETTPFMILLAAYTLLLGRYSGQNDIAVGTPIANRNRVEIEPLIGFFVNTLVMRTDLNGNPTVRELLSRIQQTTLDAYRYQDVPFEKVVEAVSPERSHNHSPLIQVLFQFANTPKASINIPGLVVEELDLDYSFAHFDITLAIQPDDSGMACYWNYNTDLFMPASIGAMAGHFQTLLAGFVDWGLNEVAQPIGELPILTPTEHTRILIDWNAPTEQYLHKANCFHHLFEAQAECTPNAVAVLFDREWQGGNSATCLTYAELNARANQVAHSLQSLDIGPEKIVGLCVERSIEWTIGFLGILKAGGAYMPIDPAYPPERLAFLLDDAAPSVILTLSQHALLFSGEMSVIYFDRDSARLNQQSTENPVSGVQPDNLAYVIYTSGSTGQPKGVLNEHRGLANLAKAQVDILGLKPNSRLLQVVSLNFDVSISDLVTAWSAGATLVLAPPEMPLAPENLVPLLNDLEISHFGMVPTLMATMDPQTVPNLQTVMVGGEACPPELVRRWSTDYRFLNFYGPTEVSICTTIMDYSDYTPRPNQSPPIGSAVADKQLYILDDHLQPLPDGIPGELYIGGPSLARGYLNRSDLTSAAFIDNPFGEGKLYKTGDLVRRLSARNQNVPAIEFLGRIDQQVKIRGFRIEIGEIEALLNEHPSIEAAVVIVRGEGADKHLIAYYVPRFVAKGKALSATLRADLKQKLPDYMIPAFFVPLDAFPRTANGKVDPNALPAPDVVQRSTALVAPRDVLEHELLGIWQRVLDSRAVSVYDNFFEIGGQSMLAVQLMARLNQALGQEIPISLLFQAPTIAEFAGALREQQTTEVGASVSQSWMEQPSLVAIQPRGTKPPLFCLPGAGGNVFGFYALANHLGPEQPLYGLQTRGLDGQCAPHTTIEAMATDYLAQIRSVQSCGPYYLAGHSLGGLIAFEMTQQLVQAGETVAPLAIIDMIAPPLVPARQEQHDEAASLVTVAAQLSAMAAQEVDLNIAALVELPAEEQILALKAALEAADILPIDSDVTQVRGMVAVFKANQQLKYCPPSTHPVPIRLFKADEQSADRAIERARMSNQTAAWGWEAYAAGSVKVVAVPGNHFTMLAEPHSRWLAEALSNID